MATDTRTPCKRVLETPELLEAILLHLPLRSIVLAQRVCVFFRSTISASPLLQQALFLMPTLSTSPSKPRPNPLLRHSPDARFLDHRCWNGVRGNADWPCDSDRLNPYHVIMGGDTSWKNMLIVQPPTKTICLTSGKCFTNEEGVRLGDLGVYLMFYEWNMFVVRSAGGGKLLWDGEDGDLYGCEAVV